MPKSGQDWQPGFLLGHPLFEIFEPLAGRLRSRDFPTHADLTALAEGERNRRAPDLEPLRFSPHTKKPRRSKRTKIVLDELYDGSIVLKREVPCLERSYHDLFNALIFSAFLRSKRHLHQRQFAALADWIGTGSQLPGKRTRQQDALTIFDEGGVILIMAEPFLSAWRSSSTPLMIDPHNPETGIVPLLFGHALLEHLYEGHSQIRASAVVIELARPLSLDGLLDEADRHLAARLSDPSEFQEPGADGIFFMDGDGFRVGPPKPSWTAWHPSDLCSP